MKLTLAFQVYNKEEYIESVMDSWISNLSGQNEYEVIIVFDDCKDRSVEIVNRYLKGKKFKYMFLFADDRYEIFCNNLALKHASGDYIVFIQDDNWIYDENWDLLLGKMLRRVDNIGAAALLAGVQMLPEQNKLRYQRIEINRPHKKEYFAAHNLPEYEVGIWQVDSVCRPFCISRELLLSYGGMDEAFSPTCGDDLDLGIKLLKEGFTNIYIPFDILNTVGSEQTITKEFHNSVYAQAYALNFERHHKYLMEQKGDSVRLLFPMKQTQTGHLMFEETGDGEQTHRISSQDNILIDQDTKKVPITLFAMPKAFRGQDAVRQKNAIKSWTLLEPRPEIILFGGDDGVAEVAEEFGLRYIPSVKRNSNGTPLINDMFEKAQTIASNNILAYVNSDIILLSDFMPAVETAAKRFNEFLMIEQRWDTDIPGLIDFEDADWEQKLREFVRQNASLHAVTGVDCFVFTKYLWSVIPPFGIGRTMWDIWLVRNALLCGQPTIDASKKVTIVHQNHEFSHIPGGTDAAIFKTEVQRNLALGGNDTSLGYTSQATWELTPDGIVFRSVSEFLKERNPSIALKCIESAYHQAPEIVKEQCQHLKVRTNPDYRSKLLAVARKELVLGLAKNAAKLLLVSLGQENISAAEESFREGFRCLRKGDASKAIKYLEKATKNCMTLPNLHYALAAAYAELGDIFSSKKACEIELSLQPDNDGARRLLERIEKAIAEYNQLQSSSTEVKV